MKSPEEIKKGCGKKGIIILNKDYGNENRFIGICNQEHLCPTCQALLEQAIEFEKEIGDLKFLLGDITIERDYYKSCFEQQAQEFKKKIKKLTDIFIKMKPSLAKMRVQELLKEVQGDKE